MLVSSARAWILDGDPPRAWQTVNQFGFVTGLLKIQGDDKQEALDSPVPGTQCARYLTKMETSMGLWPTKTPCRLPLLLW